MQGKLSLFKKLDEDLYEKAEFIVSNPLFSYENYDKEKIYIEDNEDESNTYNINELASSWSPDQHNLNIQQEFKIKKPIYLFGEEGITSKHNVIGFAIHYYSKTSNFQKTREIGQITFEDKEIEFVFNQEFSSSTLRGAVHFDFIIYLKESNKKEPFQTDIIGMTLSNEPIDTYIVLVDGDGSEFPIEEINEKGQALWKLSMNWTDIYTDPFDSSNVRLLLNKAHPLYNFLYNEKHRVNQYLLNEILITAMSMIVQKIVLIDKEEITEDAQDSSGSIAQVVWYWITTFNLNLDSLETISDSFHKKVDPFIGGPSND